MAFDSVENVVLGGLLRLGERPRALRLAGIVSQQPNGFDCGLYVLQMIEMILESYSECSAGSGRSRWLHLTFAQADVDSKRHAIFEILLAAFARARKTGVAQLTMSPPQRKRFAATAPRTMRASAAGWKLPAQRRRSRRDESGTSSDEPENGGCTSFASPAEDGDELLRLSANSSQGKGDAEGEGLSTRPLAAVLTTGSEREDCSSECSSSDTGSESEEHEAGFSFPAALQRISAVSEADMAAMCGAIQRGSWAAGEGSRPLRQKLHRWKKLFGERAVSVAVVKPLKGERVTICGRGLLRSDEVRDAITAVHAGPAKHMGIRKTFRRCCQLFLGITRSEVADVQKSCETCICFHAKAPTEKEPCHWIEVNYPWTHVEADLVDVHKYASFNEGRCFILTIMDHFSRFAVTRPLYGKSMEEVTAALCDAFLQHGFPQEVFHSDNGKEFKNSVNLAVMGSLGVAIRHGKPRKPSTQGSVEKFNSTLVGIIARDGFARGWGTCRWLETLQECTYAYNTATHDTTGHTPFEALSGRLGFPSARHALWPEASVVIAKVLEVPKEEHGIAEENAVDPEGADALEQAARESFGKEASPADNGPTVLIPNIFRDASAQTDQIAPQVSALLRQLAAPREAVRVAVCKKEAKTRSYKGDVINSTSKRKWERAALRNATVAERYRGDTNPATHRPMFAPLYASRARLLRVLPPGDMVEVSYVGEDGTEHTTFAATQNLKIVN